MKKRVLATVAVVGMFAALATAATLAVFTDQETVGANTFTTATLDLQVSPTTAVVTFSGMVPGDTVTNPLVVTNPAGSAALRYAVSSTATNADTKGLKDQLVLTVKTVDATTPGTPCDNFDGTPLYTGDLDAADGKIIGDNTQGAQAGDRSMAANTAETLCFQVKLPLATGNSYQGATTTATFTFDAEQTTNNP